MTALDVPLAPVWHDLASCAQTDPELFFPPTGDQGHEARAICAACPVQSECLQDAIDTGDLFSGIRGGKSPRQRRALARNRARQCGWCGNNLAPTANSRQRLHPDCLRQRKNARQREYDLTYTRKRNTP